MQYRVLHPSEVGQSGKMLKAQQAAGSVVTKLDREMFWKVSLAAALDLLPQALIPEPARHAMDLDF
jgi:hypothetical protein